MLTPTRDGSPPAVAHTPAGRAHLRAADMHEPERGELPERAAEHMEQAVRLNDELPLNDPPAAAPTTGLGSVVASFGDQCLDRESVCRIIEEELQAHHPDRERPVMSAMTPLSGPQCRMVPDRERLMAVCIVLDSINEADESRMIETAEAQLRTAVRRTLHHPEMQALVQTRRTPNPECQTP